MHEVVDQLHLQLSETRDPNEKIDLSLEIVWKTHRSDPTGALKLGSQALRLATTRRDQPRIARSLVAVGACSYLLSDYPGALARFQRALELVNERGDRRTFARALQGIGIVYTGTGDFVAAADALARALIVVEHASDLDDLRGSIHNSIGSLCLGTGDYTRALEHFLHCQKICEGAGNGRGVMMAITNMAVVYLNLENLEQGKEALEHAIRLAIEQQDRTTEAYSLLNLGHALHLMRQDSESLSMYERALVLARELHELSLEAETLRQTGDVHRILGDFNAALACLQPALEIREQIGDARKWSYLLGIAQVYGDLGEHERAAELLRRTLAGASQAGDRSTESMAHQELSRCFEASGNPAGAFDHYKQYMAIRNEVLGNQQQQRMTQMQMRSQIERAEKEREIMRLEKARLEQEMEHRSKELTAMALHLVEKNRFLESLKKEISEVVLTVDVKTRPVVKGLIRRVEGNLDSESDWQAFEAQFDRVHQGFVDELTRRYPSVTRMELKVCALLKIGMSTKEIANVLATTPHNIEMHRYRIRKKLGLRTGTTFADVFAGFQEGARSN